MAQVDTGKGTGSATLALVLAAGKGTRMKSATPKMLHEILGRPLIGWSLAPVLPLAPRQLTVIVGHGAEAVKAATVAFAREQGYAEEPSFVLQAEQLGTGHAVMQARAAIDAHIAEAAKTGETPLVLITSGDMPCIRPETLAGMVASHADAGAARVLTFMTATRPVTSHFGRVVRDGHGRVVRNVEYRDATTAERQLTEMNMGVYLADARFLVEALGRLSNDNDQKEYYLPDVISHAAALGAEAVATWLVADADETLGVNDRVELAEAGAVLRRRLNTAHMKAGVTFEDPATTFIEPTVTIANDVVIGAGVHLKGKTAIATGCEIEAGCFLDDTTVGEGTHFLPYCHAKEAAVGASVSVGPWARLRPGAKLGDEVKIGNFVEVKNATMGRASKAAHLTYIGDASVGIDVNIGCGTITCNHDGVFKHRTEIGDGAYIGSDTALVAPVKVGAGAIVAAGSTVVTDVPDDALYINRAEPKLKAGWAKKRWETLRAKKAALAK